MTSQVNNRWYRPAVTVALVLAIALVLGLRSPQTNHTANKADGLPRLLDLGSDRCIPCRMMMPILDALKQEQAGKLDVTFIDVWKDQTAGQEYGINSIPTQIFYDASGKEIYRHEGFFPKEDILAVFARHGIDLKTPKPAGK